MSLRRADLRAAVLEAIGGAGPPDEELLAQLWAFQTARCPALAGHARALGLEPGRPASAEARVAVPTAAFRAGDLHTWDMDRAPPAATFRSSGTTGGQPSLHHLRSLELYRAAVLAGFSLACPQIRPADRAGRGSHRVLRLVPDAEQAPHSSLARMVSWLAEWLDPEAPPASAGPDWLPDPEAFQRALAGAHANGRPALLFATTFAHVRLIEACAPATLALPPGSVVLDTGGTKGRSRAISHPELHALLCAAYAIEPAQILAEYGMAELGSQAWGFVDPAAPDRAPLLRFPPWVRWRILDPDTGHPVPGGAAGLLAIEDPVNLDSCAFVRTADLATLESSGDRPAFRILGRAAESPARGCSLSVPDSPAASAGATIPLVVGAPPQAPPPLEVRLQGLAHTFAALSASEGVTLAPLADSLGLSLPAIRAALGLECGRWTEAALRTLLARELDPWGPRAHRLEPAGPTVVLPAATVPFAGLESVALALLGGCTVAARPPRRNPHELPLFRALLEAHAPAMAPHLPLLPAGAEEPLHAALAGCAVAVVHGGVEAVAAVRAAVPPNARVLAFGPRWSLAVLAPEAARAPGNLAGLARDLLLHDSLGCLSPRLICVPGPAEAAQAVAGGLATALLELGRALPPHPEVAHRAVGAGDAELAAQLLLRRRPALQRVIPAGSARVFLLGGPAEPIEAPPAMRRALVVAPVEPAHPELWLAGPGPEGWISTAALDPALDPVLRAALVRHLVATHGLARLCAPGAMQAPPAGWAHDGQPALLPFLRLLSLR